MAPCFICAQPIINYPKENSKTFMELLTTSCKLLELGEISEEEWQISSVKVCCSGCYACLQRIKKLDGILQLAKGRLKDCLEKLELIVEESSKIKNVDVSQWSPGFFKFRNLLTWRHDQKQVEVETETTAASFQDEDPLAENNFGNDSQRLDEDQHLTNSESKVEVPVKSRQIVEKKMKGAFSSYFHNFGSRKVNTLPGPTADDGDCNPPEKTVKRFYRARKRRKIVVIAEEDEPGKESKVTREWDELEKVNSQKLDEISSESESDGDSDFAPLKRKKKPKYKYEPGSAVFNPTNSAEKWFICGINGCTTGCGWKEDWLRHSKRKHPGLDFAKIWKDMPTREFAPRRKLHCGDRKCKMSFDNRQAFNIHMKKVHPEILMRKVDPGSSEVGSKPQTRNMNLWGCDMCREQIPKTAESMLEHVRDHVGDYALKCPNPDCIFVYCTIKYFNSHAAYRQSKCFQFITEKDQFDTCEVCGFHGTTHQGLRSHLEVVHETGDSKTLPCPVQGCSEMFSHRQSVQFHISHRHSAPHKRTLLATQTTQFCPECSISLPHEEIPDHFRKFHNASMDSIISCKHCPYKSLTRLQLLNHFLVHFRQGMAIACDICPESPITTFSMLGHLRRHYFSKHQIGESFICEHCSKLFTVEARLKDHILSYHSGKEAPVYQRKFTCDECKEENPVKYDQADLTRHKIIVHGAEPYKCPSCPRTFESWKVLLNHKKSHKNVARARYPCDIPGCKTLCWSLAELQQHKMSVMHQGKTNAYVCQECGTGFNTRSTWNNHINRVHKKIKRFVCDVCGYKFANNMGLRIHYRTHTGEKPFECSVCKERFRQRPHLKSHLKTHGIKTQETNQESI